MTREEHLAPLLGVRETGTTRFTLLCPAGGIRTEAQRLAAGESTHLVLEATGPKGRLFLSYRPDNQEQVAIDPSNRTVVFLGGKCFQINEDGRQISFEYGCDGSCSLEITVKGQSCGVIIIQTPPRR